MPLLQEVVEFLDIWNVREIVWRYLQPFMDGIVQMSQMCVMDQHKLMEDDEEPDRTNKSSGKRK